MQLMGIAEFIIGRAFARPVGSAHPARCENWPPIVSPKRKILKAKSWHRASPQTKEAAN
jgi:hypothetical protein